MCISSLSHARNEAQSRCPQVFGKWNQSRIIARTARTFVRAGRSEKMRIRCILILLLATARSSMVRAPSLYLGGSWFESKRADQTGKRKPETAASPRSAVNRYCSFGLNSNWQFRFREKCIFGMQSKYGYILDSTDVS